ncbi:xanthine dehydrogenase [Bacillus ginsengihumi]|uniref:Xanthine dehydrogenase n=1 Tax=Heyndrickxia ginsengihumi TaxID=363870 RepID=A0A6M0P8L3_9BACI|nr:FAD binding domain-containing protein [Heyndrickxia ginsengihumi]NEY20220.1 xanthine dehydrogenase [Heyndrickxia ginsengihumi]
MVKQEKIPEVSSVVLRPTSIEEAWELKKEIGTHAMFISGGTLLQMKREQGTALHPYLISLEKIDGMQEIQLKQIDSEHFLVIGASVRLADVRKHALIKQEWNILTHAVKEVAAPAVRNRATIGGNVCYMVGDTIPALLALAAKACWFDGNHLQIGEIELFLQQYQLNPSLILTAIMLPSQILAENKINVYKKIGRREAFIPSLVTVSLNGSFTSEFRAEHIRIAVGGGTYLPKRLIDCEQLLHGAVLTKEKIMSLYETIIREYNPASDAFVSSEYRKMVAANLIISELSSVFDGKV